MYTLQLARKSQLLNFIDRTRVLILILILFYYEIIRDDKRVIESINYFINKTINLKQKRVINTKTIAMVKYYY